MPNIQLPLPNAYHFLVAYRQAPDGSPAPLKDFKLLVGESTILFIGDKPRALYTDGAVYFPDIDWSSAQSRKRNAFWPNAIHERVSTDLFDFFISAAFTKLATRLRSNV